MKNGISCSRCHALLTSEYFNTSGMISCPSCGVSLKIEVFPAFFKDIGPGKSAETLVVDHEAGCFYHPQKKAVIPCDSCGRFLCAMCDIELNDRHLCPNCLETNRKKGKLTQLEKRRTLYDAIALRLSVYPVILLFFGWFFTIVTAPMSIFIAIRYWNAPSSLVPRRPKFRFVMAILFSSLQLMGWGIFIWEIFS